MDILMFIVEKGINKTLKNAIAVSLKSNDIEARDELEKWVEDFEDENFYRYKPTGVIQCKTILNTYYAIDRLFDWYESPESQMRHTDVTHFCDKAINNYIYNRQKKFKNVNKKRPIKQTHTDES